MLVPGIFSKNFADDIFNEMFASPFKPFDGFDRTFKSNSIMNTDVSEYDDHYELALELPGYSKEDVSAKLDDGYLTISANRQSSNDKTDSDGKVIRKERYSGSCQRSFYVGTDVTKEDIRAAFKDGILTLNIPKKQATEAIENNNFIAIE